MESSLFKSLRGGWMLLRFLAVISSSFIAILSSLLPLYLFSTISNVFLFYILLFLSVGAIIVHGVLVHLFNDYADHQTGTVPIEELC